jgi:hypothetical protein
MGRPTIHLHIRQSLQDGLLDDAGPGLAFLDRLQRTRNFKASDKRDKIFGLMGLFDGLEKILPAPDYSKTTATVYSEVAKAIIAATKSLNVLRECRGVSDVLDLPSWAPDWSLHSKAYIHSEGFDAANGSEPIYQELKEPTSLRIAGKIVSVVDILANGATDIDETTPRDELGHVCVWPEYYALAFSLGTYPTGENLKEVLWRTLCCDRMNVECPADPKWSRSFKAWHEILVAGANTAEDLVQKWVASTDAVLYYHRVRRATREKLGCLTQNGYMALVPNTTQSKDRIEILTGGQVPFVSRPSGNHFKLIGPCYMHGIMHGEHFPAKESELQWITLR